MFMQTLITLLLATRAFALNFDWERDQLTEVEATSNRVTRFKYKDRSTVSHEGCKVIPGDDDWPSEEDWASFNATLGGVLLKPKPLASVCYAGEGYDAARCNELKSSWAGMNLQYVHRVFDW